jgi:hypothetical protein
LLLAAELLPSIGRKLSVAGCFSVTQPESAEPRNTGGFDMKALRFIRNWLYSLWDFDASVSTGIDSHTWESKIEILGSLSHGYLV